MKAFTNPFEKTIRYVFQIFETISVDSKRLFILMFPPVLVHLTTLQVSTRVDIPKALKTPFRSCCEFSTHPMRGYPQMLRHT